MQEKLQNSITELMLLKVVGGRGGHAVIHLMSGLAHSCPVLETIDFSEVTSLCPESLIYLCYQDTFSGM